MSAKDRWGMTAAIGFPLIAMTAYLTWVWPRPRGTSVIAVTGPYILSLLTGLPFAWSVTRRSGRAVLLLAFFGGALVVLWLYALLVLCGVRGVCL